MFLSVFVKAGMDNSLIFFITKKETNYISLSFFIAFVLSVVVAITSFMLIDDKDLNYFLFLVFIIASQDIFFGIYKANGKIKNYFILKSTIVICFQILLVLFGHYFLIKNLFFLLLAFSIPNALAVVIFTIKNISKFEKILFSKDFVKYSIPMMFTAMMGILMNRIDILMLGNMVDMAEIGVYRVAVQIASLSALIMGVFNIAFAPKIAALYHQDKLSELISIYTKSTRILFLVGACMLLLIYFFDTYLLQIFGDEYVYANTTLLIVSLGQFFIIAVGSVGFMLSMIGKVNLQLYRVTLAAIINVILNYLLIAKYGINGAAIASMCALFISSITGYIFLKSVLNVKVFKYF
jgi:O-antigen/teichoic acid export membrane protein